MLQGAIRFHVIRRNSISRNSSQLVRRNSPSTSPTISRNSMSLATPGEVASGICAIFAKLTNPSFVLSLLSDERTVSSIASGNPAANMPNASGNASCNVSGNVSNCDNVLTGYVDGNVTGGIVSSVLNGAAAASHCGSVNVVGNLNARNAANLNFATEFSGLDDTLKSSELYRNAANLKYDARIAQKSYATDFPPLASGAGLYFLQKDYKVAHHAISQQYLTTWVVKRRRRALR